MTQYNIEASTDVGDPCAIKKILRSHFLHDNLLQTVDDNYHTSNVMKNSDSDGSQINHIASEIQYIIIIKSRTILHVHGVHVHVCLSTLSQQLSL